MGHRWRSTPSSRVLATAAPCIVRDARHPPRLSQLPERRREPLRRVVLGREVHVDFRGAETGVAHVDPYLAHGHAAAGAQGCRRVAQVVEPASEPSLLNSTPTSARRRSARARISMCSTSSSTVHVPRSSWPGWSRAKSWLGTGRG